MSYTDTFGGYLQQLRKNAGYRQTDIAFYLCVAPNIISLWEMDFCRPSRFHLSLLDILLDIGDYGHILYCCLTPSEQKKAEKKYKELEELWENANTIKSAIHKKSLAVG